MSGLIVTRKQGETFYVGDNIKITAIGCRVGSCRLQIEAPPDVAIVREELVDDSALRSKRRLAVENLKRQLAEADRAFKSLTCPGESEVADLGRRSTDESENGFVPAGACVIADAI